MTDSSQNSKQKQVNLRNIVLNMLQENGEGKLSHLVAKDTLDNYKMLDKQQRAFVTRLFQGTVERQLELDYILNIYSKTKTNKMKPVIRNILRMAVYQLKYMQGVPNSAVCNEAVKLVQKRKIVNLKGFVNGVLRTIAKNINNIEYPYNPIERMSVQYSTPEWIIEYWTEIYGNDNTEEMLKSMYMEKKTAVRCNVSKADVNEIIDMLEAQNVTVEKAQLYENALYISNYDNLNKLAAFEGGSITVQDISSMMVGLAAAPKSGDYIIDVCAAPGGKSLHLADMLNETGHIEARDLTDYKIELINENIRRTGFKNITTIKMDATILDEASIKKADIVIADLPCSGLGVMGKKADIKYNISKNQITELAALQRDILSVVSKYVKAGGTLIFSTCTVTKEENMDNVRWIEENLPFILEESKQVFPNEKQDGFFISKFKFDLK